MDGANVGIGIGCRGTRAGRRGWIFRSGAIGAVLALLVAAAASGQLTEYDDTALPPSPDGFNITVDPLTGLEWLDLTVTMGRSFDDIVGLDGTDELGPGGDFEGFRHATAAETTGWQNGPQLDSLFKNFGMGSTFGSIAGYDIVTDFMSYLGCFTNCTTYGFGQGVYVANGDPLDPTWVQYERFPSQGFLVGSLITSASGPFTSRALNGSSAAYGHFLVREAPEPSLGLMLGGGSVLLTALGRRRGDGRASRSTSSPSARA